MLVSEAHRVEVDACLKAETCLKFATLTNQAYVREALLELAEKYLEIAEQPAAGRPAR